MKKVVLLLVFSILFCNIVYAGCCLVTDDGEFCQTQDDSTACQQFTPGDSCDFNAMCKSGCCQLEEGSCSENTYRYACEYNDGSWSDGVECSSINSCQEGCCIIEGNAASFLSTQQECDYMSDEYYGFLDNYWDASITDYVACQDVSTNQVTGCCITEDKCSYETKETCDYKEPDLVNGFGFYENSYCSEIHDALESAGIETSCDDCDDLSDACGSDGNIHQYDSCGNDEGVVEYCDYLQGLGCSDADGSPSCESLNCQGNLFNGIVADQDYGKYQTYYEKDDGSYGSINVNLENVNQRYMGESWCVYESPVGAFNDRPGSVHWVASCLNGEEQVESCGDGRESICVQNYDEATGFWSAKCEPNNFGNYDNNEYNVVSSPVGDEGDYGVSTVPIANDDCQIASTICDVLYGTTAGSAYTDAGDDVEPYINSLCLRPEWTLVTNDYCRAQGDCGWDYNVAGKKGGDSGFSIHPSTSSVNSNDVSGVNQNGEQVFAVESAAVGSGLWGNEEPACFNKGVLHSQWDEALVLQGADEIYDIPELSHGCYQPTSDYDYVEENVYDYLLGKDVLEKNFATQEMTPANFNLERVSYLGASDSWEDCSEHPNICPGDISKYKFANRIAQVLGINYNFLENIDIPNQYNVLANLAIGLRSIKPWKMDNGQDLTSDINERYLSPLRIAEDDDNPRNWDNAMTIFYGWFAPEGDYDWTELYYSADEDDDHVIVQINTQCNEWQPPSGHADCGLCTKPASEGGLALDDGKGNILPGYQCSEYQCQSLGTECQWLLVGTGICIEKEEINPPLMLLPDNHEVDYTYTQLTSNAAPNGVGGYEINEELEPWTEYALAIETDQYTYCKFFTKPDAPATLFDGATGLNTDTMNLLQTEHNLSIVAKPDPANPLVSKDYEYYARCKNWEGVETVNTFIIRFTVAGGPDNHAPEIDPVIPDAEIHEGTYYLAADVNETSVTIWTDEKSTCKWTSTSADTTYDVMENVFDYDSPISSVPYGYEHDVLLPIDLGTNYYWFRCRDVSANLNPSPTSKELVLVKTSALNISQTSPSGDLPFNDITLQVMTAGGALSGKAICYWDDGFGYQEFYNSNSNVHTHPMDNRANGEYSIDILCEDVATNSVEDEITFTIYTDDMAPQLQEVYIQNNILTVITDEEATCQYKDELFSYGAGVEMAGTISHQGELSDSEVYWVICRDIFDNEAKFQIYTEDYS